MAIPLMRVGWLLFSVCPMHSHRLATCVGENHCHGCHLPQKASRPALSAQAYAPACMQTNRIVDWYRYVAELFGGDSSYYPDLNISEDCLYLNVWSPTATDEPLPVMIWIHGGSNRSGWSYEPNYQGHNLAQQGAVVVSIGYRQGVFGFFSHPQLENTDAVANFGLWDIIAALEWVQANIAQFGGDPARVTLFGESAGAQNILALMFAEQSQKLFHGAILQSTPGFGNQRMSTLAQEQSRALELADGLGVEGGSIAALRALDAGEILAAYESDYADYYHSPALDGQLFHAPYWKRVMAGNFPDIAVIIGSNRDEWYDSLPDDIDWGRGRDACRNSTSAARRKSP